jgi:hypothetical protein
MKYSLRSLMIAVTLFCVLLGVRIEFLRRMAVFHEQEALRLAPKPNADGVVPDFGGLGVPHEYLDQFDYHERLAQYYRAAIYRPWQISPPSADDQP